MNVLPYFFITRYNIIFKEASLRIGHISLYLLLYFS
nr:MAG TPA: hypothetical protein [Caudoviricetes sp.]